MVPLIPLHPLRMVASRLIGDFWMLKDGPGCAKVFAAQFL